VIVRLFQRYASSVAALAGLVTYRLVLPKDAPWWLELSVVMAVGITVYLLLYKDGVTANRPKRGGK